MTLSVSLFGLVAGGGSGVARYAAALARGLDRVHGEFPELRLTFLTNPAGAERAPLEGIETQVVALRRQARGAWPTPPCDRARARPSSAR